MFKGAMCNHKNTIANPNLIKFTKIYRGLLKITTNVAVLLISCTGSVIYSKLT